MFRNKFKTVHRGHNSVKVLFILYRAVRVALCRWSAPENITSQHGCSSFYVLQMIQQMLTFSKC